MLVKDNYKISNNISIGTLITLNLNMTLKHFQKNVIRACKDGFKNPFIFMKGNVPILELCTSFDHTFGHENEWKKELLFIKFAINNFINIKKITKNSNTCTMFITLDKNSIEYMKGYTEKFKFRFDKGDEQREISGKFKIIPTGIDTAVLSVDEKFVSMGKKESAEPLLSLGTYHTHPLEAYKKYSICLAYPSKDDYITFLYIYSMGYGAFHIVSCVEGIYVICISPMLMKYTLEEIKEDLEKYNKSITEHYGVDYPKCKIKNKIHIKKIKNYLKITNEKPYFNVQFIEWKNATKPIKINYKRVNGNCFIRDEQIKNNKVSS